MKIFLNFRTIADDSPKHIDKQLDKQLRDDFKKKSKLRDIGPKGREGSEKNQFFSFIRKRENYLRGEGLNPKVPFLFGNFIGKF